MPQREEARTNGRGGDGDGDRRGSPSPRIAEDEAEEEEEEEEEEDRRRHKRTIGRAVRSLSKKIHGRRRRKEKQAQPPEQPPPGPEQPPPPPPRRRFASPDVGGDGGYRRSSCLCFNPNPGRYPPDSPLIAPNPSGGDPKVTKKPSTYHEFVRSLLENNDFYSGDCNVHRDITSDSDDPCSV